ncbi:MAG: hypothetical protein IJX94_04250 [Clostridia bacterium]|nr:hypothetical protein [Clostridia bacterium]
MPDRKNGVKEGLCRGRYPFAVADLLGGHAYPCACGRVEFYATPAGVVISANFTGLPGRAGQPRRGALYRFCLEGEPVRKNDRFCAMLPPLYEKEGCARFLVVTEKIVPADLIKKRICVRSCEADQDGMYGAEIAGGEVICQPCLNGRIAAV